MSFYDSSPGNSGNESTVCKTCKCSGKRFRVRVSLERFFGDERARSYVLVEARRPVRALERRLRELFALRGPLLLRSRGHLLPADEPLALLCPDDPVEVLPLSVSKHIEQNEMKEVVTTTSDQQTSRQSEDVLDTNTKEKGIKINSNQDTHVTNKNKLPVQKEELLDKDTLEEHKKQALALLENKYSQVIEGGHNSSMTASCEVSDEEHRGDHDFMFSEPSNKKRKRVRHRKRNKKSFLDNADDTDLTHNSEIISEERGCSSSQLIEKSREQRTPRVVHALDSTSVNTDTWKKNRDETETDNNVEA